MIYWFFDNILLFTSFQSIHLKALKERTMTVQSIQETLTFKDSEFIIQNLQRLEENNIGKVSTLPFAARVLIENLARNVGGGVVAWDDVLAALTFYESASGDDNLIPFYPARVLMQDFTGVPAVVDFAAMRDAVHEAGLDPRKINPLVPVDLVIDHSIQVDHFREKNAFFLNAQKEYERNAERYKLLKWAQKSFLGHAHWAQLATF